MSLSPGTDEEYSSTHGDQQLVGLDLAQLGYEPLLLFAGLLLGVQSDRHDTLLSEAQQGGLHGQGEVGLGAVPRLGHPQVEVAGRGDVGAVLTGAGRLWRGGNGASAHSDSD